MAEINNKPIRYVLQAINYSVFMAIIWYFATAPSVRLIGASEAKITIAFAHAGQLREACRRLSQEELNELPPNMRKIEDCPRERSPVTIEALLDGEPLYSAAGAVRRWRCRRFLQRQDPCRRSSFKPEDER